MTYDIYRYIFIGAAILCGIMFIVSVLVFIFLKIPKVISDLSGATAKKAIKNIREQNEASGDKGYQVSAFNKARGKLTDKISPSGNVIEHYRMQMAAVGTTKIDTQELPANETSILELNNETTVLDNQGVGETSVLSEISSAKETTVLSETVNGSAFIIEYDITFIHTDEIIEVGA